MRVDQNPSDEAVDRRVAAEVRAELGRQGMSQQKLADRLGWTQVRLSRRLSTGETSPVPFSVGELQNVADALGVPVTTFLPAPSAVTA